MNRLVWKVRKACLELRKAALEAETVLAEVDKQLAAITPKPVPKRRPHLEVIE